MNIGRKIKNIRLDNKLTQKEFADKISKSCITIRKYESGDIKPPIEVLSDISNIFNIPMNYFLEDNLKEYPTPLAMDYLYKKKSLSSTVQEDNIESDDYHKIKCISDIISTLGYNISLSDNKLSHFIILNDNSSNVSYKLTIAEFEDFYQRILWNIKQEIDFIKFKKNR